MRASLFAALLSVPLAACAKQAAAPEGLPNPHHGQGLHTSTTASLGMYPAQWGLPSRIVDTKKRMAVSLDDAMADLGTARVVYVAETHTNPHHHAVEGAILTQLWRRDRSLILGLEMFQRPYQEVVDRYLAGTIDEHELLEKAEYDDRWGYDFGLYRPLIEFARMHRIGIRALNARSELTKKVSKEGLDKLSPEEKSQLPELDLTNRAHREMIAEAFGNHELEPARFEQFYAAQVIWDETMADEVSRSLAGNSSRMVVVAGSGHVREGLGIPRRAARRGAKPFRTIIPVMLGEDQPSVEELLEDPAGDYLWVMSVEEAALPEVGRPLSDEQPTPTSVTVR